MGDESLAEPLGTRIALTARIIAFKVSPSMKGYRQSQSLSGDAWQSLKPDLLEYLRVQGGGINPEAKVQIFLHEGLVDDAISIVDYRYTRDNLIQLVMDAAMSHRPDWVIDKALPPAEDIMNRGKAESYQEAVNWLAKARTAYIQSGRQSDWQAYRKQLVDTHGRKRKLMGLINEKL
jgi:uncharacterized Zn finger protein